VTIVRICHYRPIAQKSVDEYELEVGTIIPRLSSARSAEDV
jgi:hypothetical protein